MKMLNVYYYSEFIQTSHMQNNFVLFIFLFIKYFTYIFYKIKK